MNEQVQALLEQGRAILQAKRNAAEAEAAAHRERMEQIFTGARLVALQMFNPVGASIVVEPTSPCDGWDPNWNGDHRVTFYVRPFGSLKIQVKLRGHRDGDMDGPQTWTWSNDERQLFQVQMRDDIGGFDSTDSLAEALALCERLQAAENEREAVRVKAASNSQKRTTQLSSGDKLLMALDEWLESKLPEQE